MASDEARAHIEGLIQDHERRKRVLERQQARKGYGADPAIETEIESIEAQLVELRRHLEPPRLTEETRHAVRNLYEDNIDFLVAQLAEITQRQTRTDEKVNAIFEQKNRDANWRLTVSAAIERLFGMVQANDEKRLYGQWRNLAIAGANLALLILLFVFVLWRFG